MEGWNELGAKEKVLMVMDRVCRDEVVARAGRKCGRKGFCHLFPPPTGLDLCCLVIKRHDEYVFFYELNSATWGSRP